MSMNVENQRSVRGSLVESRKTAPLLIRGLRKAFADVQAVDGLDLEVAPGECFGLLGPNGAGKTTTIEICEGLERAHKSGVVHRDLKPGILKQ